MQLKQFSWMVTACLLAAAAHAADSPQFRGPNRDGKFPETGLLKSWPDGGPPQLWTYEGLGKGYATVSVANDTLYIPSMLNDDDGYLFALTLDGKLKWKAPYGKETEDRQAPGARSALTVDGNKGYLMTGLGFVVCLDLAAEGAVLWTVDTIERFKGKTIQWDIAEAVLIDGDQLICTPGGPDASVVSLNKNTGATIWTSKGLSELSAYCSPGIITHNGRRIAVTMTEKSVVGIDAGTGEFLWKHPHETKYNIHATTPVYADGMLYYSAGYKSGGGMLRLASDGASVEQAWLESTLDCQHHGLVLLDGYVYGTSQSGKELICLELKTGKVVWHSKDVSQGVVIYADGMLYTYEGPKAGVISLVKATPEGFERTGSFTLEQGTDKHWTHPTIAGKRLYIRRGDALMAYDIAAK